VVRIPEQYSNNANVFIAVRLCLLARAPVSPFFSEYFEEFLSQNASLTQDSRKRPNLDLSMKRHHSPATSSPHHDMASLLSNTDEAETLQGMNNLGSREVGKLRHARRPRTS